MNLPPNFDWLLCPFCFRAFRKSEWRFNEADPRKSCAYQDCNEHKYSRVYSTGFSVHYWSLRLLNRHLPKTPVHGVVYSEGTVIALPHGMPKEELQELIDGLKK